ncbi:MAG: ubiquinone/menaquinone biosynthesis methyltransferase [bacterium]|nr:MAG: ubiquinone/menaquinone biosynthesis methyltransferase [bacterium]
MFSAIAGRYDLLNRLFSLGTDVRWRRELASEIPREGRLPVLDVATGTGDVPLALRASFPEDRRILGLDFTLPMLRIAAGKLAGKGARSVSLAAGDAFALPVRDGAFDAVTIAFGLRNLSDRVAALREMVRALRPGGRVVVLEFSPVQRPLIGPLFRFYFHRIMPFAGGIISGDAAAYSYLPRSVDAFPDPGLLVREMLEAGLSNVRCRSLTFGIAYLHVGEKEPTRGRGDQEKRRLTR